MRVYTKLAVVGMLALFGATACVDLEVTNPNAPDAQRALSTPGDIESLVAGAYNTWFVGTYTYDGPGLFLSNASFQHTAPWANAGMEQYARIPRIAIVNDAADPYYVNFTEPWYDMYSALAAVSDGLKALNNNPEIAEQLGAEAVDRLKAYGKFVQGMAHGSVALIYDQGFIVDETVDISTPQDPVDYMTLMDKALSYFAESAQLASGSSFSIPGTWIPAIAGSMSSAELALAAHSMAARYRAAVARTPEERAAVDWNAVMQDVNAGLQTDWVHNMDYYEGWYNAFIDYGTYPGWAENPYFIMGMADQSGNYQRWLAQPIAEKNPNPADGPILVVTEDTRFPQGATIAEQEANPGSLYVIPDWGIGNVWARPDRGSWRWSYYWHVESEQYTYWADFTWNEMDYDEMRMLKAEAMYRNGDMAGAADLINVSRTAAGLNATDAAGTNTSCVPKLPNGECGDLWEMLKWEKRLETRMKGLYGAPWYFDGRGWGDLYKGTYLQFPAPCRELQVLQLLPCYTFGGSGEYASPGSVYGFPSE